MQDTGTVFVGTVFIDFVGTVFIGFFMTQICIFFMTQDSLYFFHDPINLTIDFNSVYLSVTPVNILIRQVAKDQ